MTIEEAKKKYGDEDGYVFCGKCPLNDGNHCLCDTTDCSGYSDTHKAIADYMTKKEALTTDTPTNDIINHPSHYCRDGGMESIDEMVLVFGKEAVKNFCLCNVWKYRYRSSTKNGEEDLKKSDWYMRKYKELSNE